MIKQVFLRKLQEHNYKIGYAGVTRKGKKTEGSYATRTGLEMPGNHQGCLIKLKCLRDYGFDTRYRIAADYEQYCRISKKEKILVEEKLYICECLTGGISDKKWVRLILEYAVIQTRNYGMRKTAIYFLWRLKRALQRRIGEKQRAERSTR